MAERTSLSERRALLREGLRFVSLSRAAIRRKTAGNLRVRRKSDRTFVTDADLAAERALRAAIGRRFPDHGILGEELAPKAPGSEFQWIIDPIDGTLSFVNGIPLYGTILALHHRGTPLLGIIDHPGLGECYSAAAGLGAWTGDRRLRLKDLDGGAAAPDEVVAVGDRGHFIKCGRQAAFDRLMRRHPQVRTYADCFGHTLAVRGAVGAMVDFGLKLWDIAATEVLITEAGGSYVCVESPQKPDGLYSIVFGKPRVVDWLLPVLAG
jgi:histidinol phosphatase-like enzyme (inositol monophosphatase family)